MRKLTSSVIRVAVLFLKGLLFQMAALLLLQTAPAIAADAVDSGAEHVPPTKTSAENPQGEPAAPHETIKALVDAIRLEDESAALPEGWRVAVYHNPSNVDGRVPSGYYTATEQLLIKKLIGTKRFQVVECPECSVSATGAAADTAKKMAEAAETLKLDGWVVWNLYAPGTGRMFFNIRLTDAKTGAIKWFKSSDDKPVVAEVKKEEAEPAKKEIRHTFYTGMWGYSVRRTLLAGGTPADVTADRILALGSKLIQYRALSDVAGFGMGMEVFSNVSNMAYADIYGLDFYGELQFHLDGPFTDPATGAVYSNYNWHLSLGEMYVNGSFREIVKTGLGVQFTPRYSITIGSVYFPDGHVWLTDNKNYSSGGEFGGLSYEITFGASF